MTARLEKIENSEAYIEIEVSAEQVEEGLQYAYRKVIKQVAIPGFRKGKAPRELLELQFGKELICPVRLSNCMFQKPVERC